MKTERSARHLPLLDEYRLGDWRVRPRAGLLERGDRSERLGPKPMEVLGVLAAAAGRTVAQEEIFAAVWGDRIVEPGALARSVSEIRKALGDDAREPRYIRTVPKRGYRLIAPVTAPAVATATPAPASSAPATARPRRPRRPRRARWAVATLVLLAAVWATSGRLQSSVPRIGVLPPILPNPSSAAHELAASLDQTLPPALSRATGAGAEIVPVEGLPAGAALPWFRVPGRQRLDYLVATRVESENRFVRVSLNVQRTRDGGIVWSQVVPIRPENLSPFTHRAAHEIADALALRAPPAAGAPTPAPLPPLDAELERGLRLTEGELDFDDLVDGIEELHDVLRRRPALAEAHAALARAYLRLRFYPGDAIARVRAAEDAARRALALDPGSVAARRALAEIHFRYRFDRPAAETLLREALELEPSDPEIFFQLALVRSAAGAHDDAIRLVERGREWALATHVSAWRLVLAHALAGRHDEAREIARRHLDELRPTWFHSLALALAFELAQDGAEDEALEVINTFLLARGDRPATTLEAFWRRYRRALEHRQTIGFAHGSEIAVLSLLLGERERALDEAITACATRSGWQVPFLLVHPRVEALRAMPGFERLRECLETPVTVTPFRLGD